MRPGSKIPCIRNALPFVFGVRYDLGQFGLDVFRFHWLTAKSSKHFTSFFDSTPLDIPAWRVWQPENSNEQNYCPYKLYTDRNSVRSSIRTILCTIRDAGSQQKSDCYAKLIAGDDCASYFAWSDLRHC